MLALPISKTEQRDPRSSFLSPKARCSSDVRPSPTSSVVVVSPYVWNPFTAVSIGGSNPRCSAILWGAGLYRFSSHTSRYSFERARHRSLECCVRKPAGSPSSRSFSAVSNFSLGVLLLPRSHDWPFFVLRIAHYMSRTDVAFCIY